MRSARRSAGRRPPCGRRPPVAERDCGPLPRRTRPVIRFGSSRPVRTPAGRRSGPWFRSPVRRQRRRVHARARSAFGRGRRGRTRFPASRALQGEPRGMHPHDDIVLSGMGVGHVREGEPTDTRVTVSNGDGLHAGSLLEEMCHPRRMGTSTVEAAPRPRRRPGARTTRMFPHLVFHGSLISSARARR